MPYINLNKDFLKTGGLVLSGDIAAIGTIEAILKTLKVGYTHTSE